MDLFEAVQVRHSVRSFYDKEIAPDIIEQLQQEIKTINDATGLSIQLCLNEPKAFESFLAKYGVFSHVNNYISLVGRKEAETEELCGYYGEKLVLLLQQLGLKSCWVGGTYNKRKARVKVGFREKLHVVIAFGYGDGSGTQHRIKKLEDVCEVIDGEMPVWFQKAMEAVQLGPSAMNQQRYFFTLRGKEVIPRAHKGFYTHIDLGIAKYHFEIGAAAAGATQDDWYWGESS